MRHPDVKQVHGLFAVAEVEPPENFLYNLLVTRKISISVGEFYHLYNRGTDKREIFADDYDYKRFVFLLYIANNKEPIEIKNLISGGSISGGSTSGSATSGSAGLFDVGINVGAKDKLVDIGAYCLMPNHFHVLAREKVDGGISRFIQKLSTGYTMYFNKKYSRSGSLFQGRFKAQHLNNDRYLKYIFSYIHLNPVKIIESNWKESGIKNRKRALDYLADYTFSSYPDYLSRGNGRKEGIILHKPAFPDYFSGLSDFSRTVEEWLSYKTPEVQPPQRRLNLRSLRRL